MNDESPFHSAAARDLGIALMRRYVVQAASTPDTGGSRNRDKVTEFFDKMAPEIHSRPEGRDWFGTPLLRTLQTITDSDFLTMHRL